MYFFSGKEGWFSLKIFGKQNRPSDWRKDKVFSFQATEKEEELRSPTAKIK